jgi:hypothetical protein
VHAFADLKYQRVENLIDNRNTIQEYCKLRLRKNPNFLKNIEPPLESYP